MLKGFCICYNIKRDWWERSSGEERLPYKQEVVGSSPAAPTRSSGQVAQLVEHWTENPGVGGSIPPLATIFLNIS